MCEWAAIGGDADDGGAPSEPALDSRLTHGPLLGAVTDRSIKVWARGDSAGRFAVRVWPMDDWGDEQCSALAHFVAACDGTGVVTVQGLEPGTQYAYRVEVLDEAHGACWATASDQYTFRTLPQAGAPARLRFVVGADVRGGDVPGFARVQAVAPDFVLMIGDNVYAGDRGHVDGYFAASYELGQGLYQEVWGGNQFRALFAQTPVFMTWDDHEIMENYWRGKDDFRYSVGRALYDVYQGSHNPAPLVDGEVYYTFHAGQVGFFVFDTRSHRDDNMKKDGPEKSMLGPEQRRAFENWLTHDDSKVHVIVSSVMVSDFKNTGADPWASFAHERDGWLDFIAARGTRNTIIVSGDQHWSAVLRLSSGQADPYAMYEFQTTPLGSGVRMLPTGKDEGVLTLNNAQQVFGVFDVDTRVDPPVLDFTVCAADRGCIPHEESAPAWTSDGTRVPYTLRFVGGARGFSIVSEI
jgi:phosphodiesterase/alkaline phosphatase D-like protein